MDASYVKGKIYISFMLVDMFALKTKGQVLRIPPAWLFKLSPCIPVFMKFYVIYS